MLRRIPTEASSTTRLEPPYETNGSGTPVRGAIASTAARLTAAWPQMSEVIPAATSFPKGSRQRRATEKPAKAKSPNASTTPAVPINPSSSPTTARIMSVCCSGR